MRADQATGALAGAAGISLAGNRCCIGPQAGGHILQLQQEEGLYTCCSPCRSAGELKRDFKHLAVDMYVITDEEGQKLLKVDAHFGKRKTLAVLRTTTTHVEVSHCRDARS